VKSVLCYPELLLAEISSQIEAEQIEVSGGMIDQEIKAVNRRLRQYAAQERRLIHAFKVGFTPDVILDEMNQTKKEKEADQARLASLVETREKIAKVGDYKGKVQDLCARIVPDLENCTNQDKKDAYRYLDLKITARPEGAYIKGYLKPDVIQADSYVLTTGQTWA